jgi:hypothetical protein
MLRNEGLARKQLVGRLRAASSVIQETSFRAGLKMHSHRHNHGAAGEAVFAVGSFSGEAAPWFG